MNYCQLGHFHLGLNTGILPAICQELLRWHLLSTCHMTSKPAAVSPGAITHPMGHTAGPQPSPPQGTSENQCLNEAMLISCMPQVWCHPLWHRNQDVYSLHYTKMQELKLTCLRFCYNMVIIKKQNYHYKVNSSLSSYKQVFNLHQKFTFQISSQPGMVQARSGTPGWWVLQGLGAGALWLPRNITNI